MSHLDAPSVSPHQPLTLRLHLWWTMVLVVAALGGAGLAVAADRPGNPLQRPELTYVADQAAQPWIDHMATDLESVQAGAADLSTTGRTILDRLQSLDRAGAVAALASGDMTAQRVAAMVVGLRETEQRASGAIEIWRLGTTTADLYQRVGVAIDAADQLSSDWALLATTGQQVVAMLEALDDHDHAVFQATTAGRDRRWADAIALLNGAAADAMSIAAAARDLLAAAGTVETLDDLLARQRAYDAALVALYQYLADGGAQSGRRFGDLRTAVERTQAALPSDTSALVVIVGEASGLPIADQLLAMDKAHGVITDTLEAISDATVTAP
jgi:hypothetical protein